MAISMPSMRTSWVKRAVPSDLALASLRRTRSVPTRVKVFGSFSGGSAGGVCLAASGSSCAKVAFLRDAAWLTTLSLTVISAAGAFHFVAAAWTNMARAPAPALCSCGQELAIAEDPPVPWKPKVVLA